MKYPDYENGGTNRMFFFQDFFRPVTYFAFFKLFTKKLISYLHLINKVY